MVCLVEQKRQRIDNESLPLFGVVEMCVNGKGAKWCFLLNPPKIIIPIREGKCEEKWFLNGIYYFVILNYNLFYHLLNPNVIKV